LFALKRRGDEAGLLPFSPHDLRRTFISNLLDAGVDILIVQRLAGHISPATTARYDKRGEAASRRAMQLIDVPYRGLPGGNGE
jgi:integrase